MEKDPAKEKNEPTAPADDELVDYNEDEEDHSEDMDSLDPAAQALQVQPSCLLLLCVFFNIPCLCQLFFFFYVL